MNKELIKFIELCLADGVISDIERKVIFRKAKELGVPKDECEIILEGLVLKNPKPVRKSKEITTKKATKKKEEIIDSRKPGKKEQKETQRKPRKIKTPKVIRVILTMLLGFGYFLLAIILSSFFIEVNAATAGEDVFFRIVFGFLTTGVPIILAYFIFRLFKLQFEFFYFSFCAALIILLGMNYDGGSITYSASDYDIARDFTTNRNGVMFFIIDNWWIILAVFFSYIFLTPAFFKSGKSTNKDIEKFENYKDGELIKD